MCIAFRALALLVSLLAVPAIAQAQLPTVTIAAVDAAASEVGPDAGTFRITRTGSTSVGLSVFFTIGGSATNGADYQGIAGSINIPAGASFVDRVITAVNDPSLEGPETVVLTLSSNAQYVVGAADDATVTIADNPSPVVSITASDAAASEVGPDAGAFRISRVGDAAFGLTVFFTIGGSATNGADYQGIAGSINIPAGASFVDRVITAVNDPSLEGPETVVLTLSSNAQYVVGAADDATVTIADNPSPVVSITASDAAASEVGPDAGAFRISRVGDAAFGLTVFFTIGGSATNGADYQGIAGSINIPAGASFVDRVITAVNDPSLEGPETVVLTLSSNAQYVVGAADDATVTIADNPSPVVSITASDAAASEVGPDAGAFRISRVGDAAFGLTVFFTIGGSATNGADYQGISGSINIPAGASFVDRVITAVNDPSLEGPETVVLTLSSNAQYVVGTADDATVTIADNPSPVVSITASDAAASEVGPDAGAFRISRVGDTAFGLTVFFTIGGSATNGADYQGISGSINIPAGASFVDRVITPTTDMLTEGPETVVLTLGGNAQYVVGTPDDATVTIADNGVPTTTTTTSTTSTTTTSTTTSTTTTTTTSTTTSSTSTSSTSSTSTTTTTTTLPPDDCTTAPVGPTLFSIECRIADLVDATRAESGLGAAQEKLLGTLQNATEREMLARSLCAAGQIRRPRERLADLARQLGQYSHRLRNRAARRKIDAGVREPLALEADAIRDDVRGLRAGLLCPDATMMP